MKTKVCLAVVVSVLLSLLAFPALAGTYDIPMWVSHARLAWVGRSSTGTDAVVGLIFVRDANRQRVAGASVTVVWYLDGARFSTETVTTSVHGYARSSVWRGKGVYVMRVISVTKAGWLYYSTFGTTATYAVW